MERKEALEAVARHFGPGAEIQTAVFESGSWLVAVRPGKLMVGEVRETGLSISIMRVDFDGKSVVVVVSAR